MDDNSGSKKKILIVDDQAELTDLYQKTFLDAGFDAAKAHDTGSALVTAREFKPDVILLDLMMPGVSGLDAIDLLRHSEESKNAIIIVLSALSLSEYIDKARQHGIDDYIVKGDTSMDEIVVRVKKALGLGD